MKIFKSKLIYILLSLSALLSAMPAWASDFKNEVLHYTISYKWGMIHKDAGKATLRLSNSGNHYKLSLTAYTLPWADKIFQVRDTLLSTVTKNNFRVTEYMKNTHEGGKYNRDIIHFTYGGSAAKGSVKKIRQQKDGSFKVTNKVLTGGIPVYDMLSVFYYMRKLDYASMKKGVVYKVTIFSGSKSETLTIKNLGIENIKLRNKTTRSAYKLSLSFTTGGKKKSSDDISAWISSDSSHIPLYVVGKLPIGQVRVYLTN